MYNDAVNDDKIDDLNKEDVLYLRDGLADNNNDNNNNNNNNYSRCGIGVISSR